MGRSKGKPSDETASNTDRVHSCYRVGVGFLLARSYLSWHLSTNRHSSTPISIPPWEANGEIPAADF